MIPHNDIWGKPIKAGDFVVYGVEGKSRGGLRIALVRLVHPEDPRVQVLSNSFIDYRYRAEKSFWVGTEHMMIIDENQLHPGLVRELKKWNRIKTKGEQ